MSLSTGEASFGANGGTVPATPREATPQGYTVAAPGNPDTPIVFTDFGLDPTILRALT